MNEYFTQQEEDKKNMRKMVEQIMKGHEGAREARIQLQQMKHKIGNSNNNGMISNYW